MKGITLGILKLENKACCMVRSINKTGLNYTPFSWFSSRIIDFRSNEVKVKGITAYFAWCRRWRYGQEFLKISILKYLEHISISNMISNWLWADNRNEHSHSFYFSFSVGWGLNFICFLNLPISLHHKQPSGVYPLFATEMSHII